MLNTFHAPKAIGFSIKLFSTLFFCIVLSGCSSLGIDEPVANPPIERLVEATGTNGLLIPIQSDNVHAAGYDETTLVMTIQFNSGYTYEYYGVPAELWNSFVAAQPHPWSQIGNPRLVQAGVPYKRIS